MHLQLQLRFCWTCYTLAIVFLRKVVAPPPAPMTQLEQLHQIRALALEWNLRWSHMLHTLTCTQLTFRLQKMITIPATDPTSCNLACAFEATDFQSIDAQLQLMDHEVFGFTCLRSPNICLLTLGRELTLSPHFNPLPTATFSRFDRFRRLVEATSVLTASVCVQQLAALRNFLTPGEKGTVWVTLPEQLCNLLLMIREVIDQPSTSNQGPAADRQCVCDAVIHHPSMLSVSQHPTSVPSGIQHLFSTCDPGQIITTTIRNGWVFHSMVETFPLFSCIWQYDCPAVDVLIALMESGPLQ